jgi:hypothetical protein
MLTSMLLVLFLLKKGSQGWMRELWKELSLTNDLLKKVFSNLSIYPPLLSEDLSFASED